MTPQLTGCNLLAQLLRYHHQAITCRKGIDCTRHRITLFVVCAVLCPLGFIHESEILQDRLKVLDGLRDLMAMSQERLGGLGVNYFLSFWPM